MRRLLMGDRAPNQFSALVSFRFSRPLLFSCPYAELRASRSFRRDRFTSCTLEHTATGEGYNTPGFPADPVEHVVLIHH